MFSAINPWKINPKPAGIAIYGASNPKARPQATARLSIFNLFIKPNNGGTRIGMNAIWTGIKFCDKIAIPVKINISIYFFDLIIFEILVAKIGARPVWVIEAANAPNKI